MMSKGSWAKDELQQIEHVNYTVDASSKIWTHTLKNLKMNEHPFISSHYKSSLGDVQQLQ